MLEIATRGHPTLSPCDLETERSGPSFTVDTLAELHALHRDTELFLIVGIDAYREVDTWHRPEQLLELANVVVTTRPGHDLRPEEVLPPIAARADSGYDPTHRLSEAQERASAPHPPTRRYSSFIYGDSPTRSRRVST